MYKTQFFLFLSLFFVAKVYSETNENKPKTDSQGNLTEKQNAKDPIIAETESLLKAAMRFSVTYDPELYDYLYESAPLEIKNFVELVRQAKSLRLEYKKYQELVPRRLLLVGPPGVGKSTLAYAIAHKLNHEIYFIKVPLLGNEYINSAPSNLRRLVERAIESKKPTIIVLDEINFIANEKNVGFNHTHEMNAAASLWLLLDECSVYSYITVIATANDVSQLPGPLKDRFEGNIVEIYENNTFRRLQVLNYHLSQAEHTLDYNYLLRLAEKTTQFSPRQLEMLIKIARQQQFLLTGSIDGISEEQLEDAYQKILKNSDILKSKSGLNIRKWINENAPLIHTLSSSISLGIMLFNISYFMFANKNQKNA